MAKLAVVILNWNGKKFLEQYLPALVKYLPDYAEIVVADNASTDGSYEHLKRAFNKTEVDVLEAPVNGGYASGNNFGIRYAIQHYSPDYVFVANPDIAVSEDTLKRMIAAMKEHYLDQRVLGHFPP